MPSTKAPLLSAGRVSVAMPAASTAPCACWVWPPGPRAVASTCRPGARSPATWTVTVMTCPTCARPGASTWEMRVAEAARPTATQCSGRPASRTACRPRSVSPWLAWPSEMSTSPATGLAAWLASAVSRAACRLVAVGSSPPAARCPAKTSGCTSPPAACTARVSVCKAWSACAWGTLFDRSSSTSNRGRLRASSQDTDARASSSANSADACSARAAPVRSRCAVMPAPGAAPVGPAPAVPRAAPGRPAPAATARCPPSGALRP